MPEPLQIPYDVGTTAVEILPPNRPVQYVLFSNDSDTAIYISLGQQAVAHQGIRLNANGGWYEISATNMYRGRVWAISTAATKRLNVVVINAYL